MRVVEKSIEIRAPVEKVWKLVSDTTRLPEWMPLQSARLTSTQKDGIGVTCVCEPADKRLGSTVTEEVVEWEDLKRVKRRVVAAPVKRMFETNTLSPTPNGTLFTIRGEFELGGFKKLFGGMVEKSFAKNMDAALMKLKTKLEA